MFSFLDLLDAVPAALGLLALEQGLPHLALAALERLVEALVLLRGQAFDESPRLRFKPRTIGLVVFGGLQVELI